jgi:GAF domain-containing protein
VAVHESVVVLQERLASEQRLVHLIDRIHSATSLDGIFIEIHGEILACFEAERMTLYAVDHDTKEIYSKFLALDSVKEIRVPISGKSVAGFVAASGQTVNIADAHDAAELKRLSPELLFDTSFDERTGFRTRQILCMPVLHEDTILGVVQFLNKQGGPRFTREDEVNVARVARTLGLAFHNQAALARRRDTT